MNKIKDVLSLDEGKNKSVKCGAVRGKVFVKIVEKSRHYMRKYGGYAISWEVLNNLKDKGIEYIEIHEIGGKDYIVSIDSYLMSGIEFNVGHGPQVCLPETFYEIKEKSHETPR